MSGRILLVALLALPADTLAAGGRWEVRAPLGVPRQETGVAAVGQTLYALGGFEDGTPTATVEAYDPARDQWRVVAPLPLAVHHAGAAAAGGKLYAVGGLVTGAFAAEDAVFEYDPGTDAWRARAALPTARGAVGIAVIAERIYAAGGFRDGVSVADFAVYDPAADVWAVLPPMPTARDHLAAAALDGVFYAVGGRAGGQLFAALEAFDPAVGTWRTDLPAMPTARGGLMAAAAGSRLFAFGGEGNAANPLGVFPEVEAYDVVARRWLRLTPMRTPRHGTAAATIGGVVFVPGGASRQGFGISPVNEVFLPPGADVLDVRRGRLRVRRTDTRLVLRGRIGSPATDPSQTSLVLRLLDGERLLAQVALPPDSLVANRRRTRFTYHAPRADPPSAGRLVRVILVRRRAGAFNVRLSALLPPLPDAPAEVAVVLALDDEAFCATIKRR